MSRTEGSFVEKQRPNPFSWARLGCGLGFRKEYFGNLFENRRDISWLEIITENFLDAQGLPQKHLLQLRQDYPLVCHGVSLSIASTDPLDVDYLRKLKKFYAELQPLMISDHLCWTGVDHQNMHQLLPLPRTEEMLEHLVARIAQVQDILGRRMLFENISTYLDFSESAFSEGEFIVAIAEKADCGLLVDINNVYVNAFNHSYAAIDYLRQMPVERIGYMHLSGHLDMGEYLFDAHNSPVTEDVWALYRQALDHFGPLSTLIEWDAELPEYEILADEVTRAQTEQNRLKHNEFKTNPSPIHASHP